MSGRTGSPTEPVSRRKTSSSRCRPARRSPRARSRSASQAVRAATNDGTGAAATRYSPGGPSLTAAPIRAAERAGVEAGLGRETELFGPTLDLASAPGGDDLAMVDDDDPVGEALHLVELVAREDDADAVRAQAGNYIADRDAAGRVDSGRRLVEKDRTRLSDQRQGESEALLLAARESLEGGSGHGAEPDEVDQLVGVARVFVVGGEQAHGARGVHDRVDAAPLQHDADAGRELAVVATGSSPRTRTVPSSGRR